MRAHPVVFRRGLLVAATLALLVIAALRIRPLEAFQAAIPMSRPGQEDLTFWVNHNGLEQLDVLGEVGFGDMARILMRRRSNAPLIRPLRDRFTFKVRDVAAIRTPDTFRAVLTDSGLEWSQHPPEFVIAACHTFNLPLIVENQTGGALRLQARFQGSTAASEFAAELAPRSVGAYFLRVIESEPGIRKGRLIVQDGGRELASDIRFDVRPLVRAAIKLVDPDGRPATARIYLTGSDGLAYAPAGSINRYTAMSAEPFFHAEDQFALDLPAGKTLIEATRGQEYSVVTQTVDLAPGSSPSLTVQLKRWVDMSAGGWYSSDAHIHANYTAPHHQAINAHDVRLYAHAEDLNNANMMVANSSGDFLHDFQYFEGKPHALSDSRFILYWNEEMRNGGPYGHMSFYNLKRLVYPLLTGTRGTAFADDYPANFTQAEAARRQGGAVTYVHPAMEPNFENMGGVAARELPVDLALGEVDAIDVVSNVDEFAAMEIWYRLLNCGFRLAISAGTDSFTNVADHYTPGGGRVYVHSGDALRYQDWVRAYKQGRSFASNGPVVLLTVNGKEPGDELQFPEGSRPRVRVKASVQTQVPIDRFEVVVNGRPAITRDANNKLRIDIDEELTLDGTSWIAARATGPWHRLILNDTETFAHTSPVYVRTGSQRLVIAADAKFYEEWVGKLITQVNQRGRFSKPEQRKEVIDLFQRAQELYRHLQRQARAD